MTYLRGGLRCLLMAATVLAAPVPGVAQAGASAARSRESGPASDAAVTARADALLAQMTPEEKAGQIALYFYIVQAKALTAGIDKAVAAGEVGGALFVSDAASINRLQKIAVEQSRLKIPLLIGFDVVHGLRTIMPVPIGLAASWDPALVERVETVAANEARAVGINWVFAPNVDIARDPRWGRMVEGAGEDPYLGSAMAAAHVRGFQGPYIGTPGRVIAGPKHFAAYGASLGGRDYDEVQVSDNDLWNVYLPPFKAAIDAGAGNIMSAYMPLNGVPATGNPWLLTKVLRDAWGFKGFVVSDAGAVLSLTAQGFSKDKSDAAIRAVTAGVDMEMSQPGLQPAARTLPAALKAGTVSPAAVDAAVRRILEAKIRLGLFENPYVDESRTEAVLDDPAHLDVARIAAERSAVLLRNEGGVLPLDRKRVTSIAVIGPLADSERDMLGSWIFPPMQPKATTILAGIRAKVGSAVRVDYVEGVRIPPRDVPSPFSGLDKKVVRPAVDEAAEIARAVDAARKADVAVLALGESQDMSGESASRSSLDLPGSQQALLDAVIATGKPVVVILMSPRPLDLKGSKPAALIDLWYPGSAGGPAAANLLFGDAAPGGRLPFTWIADVAHAPNHYGQLLSFDNRKTNKRYWNDVDSTPTYPFGFGLSYSRFAYDKLVVANRNVGPDDDVEVRVDLTNAGQRPADEVAQLYIHQRYGGASRPVRELKGFQRVTLKPGERRTLRFTLKPADRRYWNPTTKVWTADDAAFDVWVGGSSAATLADTFQVSRAK